MIQKVGQRMKGRGRFSRSAASSLALLLIVGCSDERLGRGRDRGEQEAWDVQPITLQAQLLSDAPALGRPSRLHVSESHLWVVDSHSDPGLHVLDVETGAVILSVGRRGEGPGDFYRYPFSLHSRSDDGDAVWAWDMSLQRLTRFEPRPPVDYEFEVITIRGEEQVLRLVWVDSGEMIGTAYSEPNRFQAFSRDGEFLRSIPGALLGPPAASISERLRATATGVVVEPWPGHGFVIAHLLSSRIEYYDANANLVRLADVPDPWGPVFEEGRTGDLVFNNRRSAYRSCSTTEDYLFALYSGRPDSIEDRAWAQSSKFLHVFDWEGNLRALFQLDRDVGEITVDPSGTTLFAASLFDSHIYKYALPVIGEG